MKIRILPSHRFGHWHYKVTSGKTTITFSAHHYTRKSDAKRAAKRLIKGMRTAKIVEAVSC